MFHFEGISRLSQLETATQRVFVRADLECPFDREGKLLDDSKIRAASETLRHLLAQQAQVVVGAHLTPAAVRRSDADSRFEQCAERLAEVVGVEVYVPDEVLGPMARKLMNDLRPDRLMLLPDLGACADELAGSEAFARQLCAPYDLYVGDCLSGPPHFASLSLMPRLSRDRTLGLRAEREVLAANRYQKTDRSRALLVVGGRFDERQELLDWAVRTQRTVMAVGEVGATLLAAQGHPVGATPIDAALLPAARTWLGQARAADVTLALPNDFYVAGQRAAGEPHTLGELGPSERIIDTGPSARELLATLLGRHESVLLVGSWSLDRKPPRELPSALSALRESGAFSLLIHDSELCVHDAFDPEASSAYGFVSTADGALLNLLQDKRVAVLENLRTPD